MKLRTVIQIGADGKQAARVFAGLKEDANELDDAGERAGMSFSKAAEAAGGMPGPLGAAAGFMSGPAGLVAGAGALGAALFGAANQAAEAAVEVGTLAELTSTSTEEASQLVAVFDKAGVESKDLSDIMLQTAGVLADDVDLAEQLGVNIGKGATSATVFQEAVDAWRLTDELERGVLGAKLFGEEGVRQMSAVIRRVDDLGEAMEDVDENVIFSDADVAQAVEYENSMAEINEAMKGLAVEVGQRAIPALSTLGQIFERIGDLPLPDTNEIAEAEASILTLADAAKNVEEATRAYWESFGESQGAGTALDAVLGKTGEVTSAIGEASTATAGWETNVNSVKSAFDELRGEINREQMLADLDDQFDELKGAAWRYADAVINGNGDAVVAQQEYEQTLRDTQLEIIGVGDEFGALPTEIETIIDIDDMGSIEAMEERIKNLVRNRQLWVQVRADDLPGQGGPSDPWTQWNAPAQPGTVVNVTMHGQASSREMANAVAQWTANG